MTKNNMDMDIDMGKENKYVEIYYAKLNSKEDIPCDMVRNNYLDIELYLSNKSKERVVFLFTFNEHNFEELDEGDYDVSNSPMIVVTEYLSSIFEIIKTKKFYLESKKIDGEYYCHKYYETEYKSIFIQEYSSFEEAYAVALAMKETSELCYKKNE